jgi:hypothetical protein
VPRPSIVGGHDTEAIRDKEGDDAAPFPPSLGKTMKKNGRALSLSRSDEMEA